MSDYFRYPSIIKKGNVYYISINSGHKHRGETHICKIAGNRHIKKYPIISKNISGDKNELFKFSATYISHNFTLFEHNNSYFGLGGINLNQSPFNGKGFVKPGSSEKEIANFNKITKSGIFLLKSKNLKDWQFVQNLPILDKNNILKSYCGIEDKCGLFDSNICCFFSKIVNKFILYTRANIRIGCRFIQYATSDNMIDWSEFNLINDDSFIKPCTIIDTTKRKKQWLFRKKTSENSSFDNYYMFKCCELYNLKIFFALVPYTNKWYKPDQKYIKKLISFDSINWISCGKLVDTDLHTDDKHINTHIAEIRYSDNKLSIFLLEDCYQNKPYITRYKFNISDLVKKVSDDNISISKMSIIKEYFKKLTIVRNNRPLFYNFESSIYPMSLSIPSEKIGLYDIQKTKIMSDLIPGNTDTYIYNSEENYYQEYVKSYFAITTKKRGWDCLRHYEILANNCIPYFIDIEKCPEKTMILFPKELIIKGNNLYDEKFKNKEMYDLTQDTIDVYNNLRSELFAYTKKYLTTDYMARYILQKINKPDVKRILFLSGSVQPNMNRCLTLHGFKKILGNNCHDYPKIHHIYKSKINDVIIKSSKVSNSNPCLDHHRQMPRHLCHGKWYDKKDKLRIKKFKKKIPAENYNIIPTYGKPLYGKGFTYTNLLTPEYRNDNLDVSLINDIKNKYYDLVIYGSNIFGKGINSEDCALPYYSIISEKYQPNEIAILYGHDLPREHYEKIGKSINTNINNGNLIFIREY